MENLYSYTLNFSNWAKRIYENYSTKNLLLDPKKSITRKSLVQHREKVWKSIKDPANSNLYSDLRQYRNSCMLSIMTRDYLNLSSLEENLSSISYLAELCIQAAYNHSIFMESKKYGTPTGLNSRISNLLVIAMGKLGGYELNPSSDVDLIFIHTENGHTIPTNSEQKTIENSLFFSKVIKKMSSVLSLDTQEGYVFKVDLRLRPHGNFGPDSISIDALKKYFFSDALDWERFAWIKSRVINSSFPKEKSEFTRIVEKLNNLKNQFIYKPYLDFESVGSLRSLNEKIKMNHNSSNEKKTSSYFFNVKLENGGIRDIEFLVQVQQLIRGGNHKSLRFQSTIKSLKELSRLDFISTKDELAVQEAYKFWRSVEHRIQYDTNIQSHTIKTDELKRICESMKLKDVSELKQVIDKHKKKIISIVNKSLNIKKTKLITKQVGRHKKHKEKNFSSNSFDELIVSLRCKPSYSKMLDEYPSIIEKIFRITSGSIWITDYIRKHPSVLDELFKKTFVTNPINFEKVKTDLHIQLDLSNEDNKFDSENQINILREFHHANLFRLLIQDYEKKWNIQELSEQLSNLADLIIDTTLSCILKIIKTHTRISPEIAIIAFGKLGGKELGFASDLDLIFLTNHLNENEQSLYFKVIKRFISWLSISTSSGNLFNIDLRLRPNGSSGLLVTSLNAFSEYQMNKAWLWEHQAVSRSRFCGGNKMIGNEFEKIRRNILKIKRKPANLLEEIISMREKITKSHVNNSRFFDIKYDKGGMVDIEFIVQTIVLRYSSTHSSFTKNVGNINLLHSFAETKVLPVQLTKKISKIYAKYRTLQHKYRLKGIESVRVDKENFVNDRRCVNELWDRVFKDAPKIIRKLSELHPGN